MDVVGRRAFFEAAVGGVVGAGMLSGMELTTADRGGVTWVAAEQAPSDASVAPTHHIKVAHGDTLLIEMPNSVRFPRKIDKLMVW